MLHTNKRKGDFAVGFWFYRLAMDLLIPLLGALIPTERALRPPLMNPADANNKKRGHPMDVLFLVETTELESVTPCV